MGGMVFVILGMAVVALLGNVAFAEKAVGIALLVVIQMPVVTAASAIATPNAAPTCVVTDAVAMAEAV
jgi:hypothetical protein